MTDSRAGRPPRLVSVCVYLGVLGAFQVVQVITVLSSWYSTTGQKQVKRFTAPLVDAGLSRADAETAYRVYLGVLAILAASALVFAVYTAMGDAVSRIMLTITAPLMALVGMGEGSVFAIALSVVTFYCVFQLWSPDVRQWFARLSGKPHPTPTAAAAQTPQAVQPIAAPLPHGVAQQSGPRPSVPKDWVKIWSLITLIASALIAAGCGAFLVAYGVAREKLVRSEVESPGNWANLTEAEIRDGLHSLAVLSWAVLPLCLVAIVVSSILLIRRRGHS